MGDVYPVSMRPETLGALCAHAVLGRVRFKARAWRGNPALIEDAARLLVTIPGVTSVASNPLTGSIVVAYDPSSLPEQQLATELQQRGFPPAPIVRPRHPAEDLNISEELVGLVGRMLMEMTAKRLAAVLIAAVV